MSTHFGSSVGFHPSFRDRVRKRRRIACTELLLTLALAVSTVIAMTAISIGIARADTLGAVIPAESSAVGVAVLVGSVLAVMGGLTAFVTRTSEARIRKVK